MLSFMTFLRNGEMTAKATTQRSNFPFNSFCNFNGEFLAAGAEGLVKFGGDTDAGANIDSWFSPIQTDFGDTVDKRMRYSHISGQFVGEFYVAATADDQPPVVYPIFVVQDRDDVQRLKIKMGEGHRGTYWSYKFGNVNGEYYEIAKIEILPNMITLGDRKF